jgi:hypothetical protein
MIKYFVLIAFLFLVWSCDEKKSEVEPDKVVIEESETVKVPQDSSNILTNKSTLSPQNNLVLDSLTPVELLNKYSENVYEKYGLEFSGNCYACDLAEVKINAQSITIFNTCDHKNRVDLKILNTEISENNLKIETQKVIFTFLKISNKENEALYHLQLDGSFLKKNLRLGEFYIFTKSLPKFDVHDCGDFQG